MANDIYSKGNVLINNLNITDEDTLKQAEVDFATVRIYEVLSDDRFDLSTRELRNINNRIFGDVYPFAGQYRKINIEKYEPVLKGLSVTYADHNLIDSKLEELMERYRLLQVDEYFIDNLTDIIIDIWQVHPFREGNTRTLIVFVCKYLETLQIDVDYDLLLNNIKYLRTSLVRATYEDTEIGFYKDKSYFMKIFNDAIKRNVKHK